MKIGFVFDDTLDKPDGVQQYILTLGSWLKLQGHEVHYLVGHTKRTDIPNVHSLSHNLPVRYNRNRLSIPLMASKRKIKTLLNELHFDVLHIQVPYSPQLAAKVIRLAPAKTAIVGTWHIMPFSWLQKVGTKLLSVLITNTLKRFDYLTAVSDASAQFAQDCTGMVTPVIPNAVNLGSFIHGTRLTAYSDGQKNIIFLGRLVGRKGAKELLAAINLLNQTGKMAGRQVLIGGSGPELGKLKKYVSKHKLGSLVKFVGQLEEANKPNFLASANVVVLPSLGGESFGITVVEAIASGAGAVIGGDNPGYKFVLADTPLALVDPRDAKLLATKIDLLLSDEVARKHVQAAQLERIKQFDVQSVGPRLVDLYTQAMAKHDKV